MSTLTRVKLALALVGVIVFAAGIRLDDGRLRYVGIGFVAAAWLLRFVKPKPPAEPPPPDSAPPA
ncbi:MAG TPA: hypothetical protein VLE53_05500 [Gemmatimonadaceae bacterium]|nr:hypothetical protein [Gemmatimonadaceae bacterium]